MERKVQYWAFSACVNRETGEYCDAGFPMEACAENRNRPADLRTLCTPRSGKAYIRRRARPKAPSRAASLVNEINLALPWAKILSTGELVHRIIST